MKRTFLGIWAALSLVLVPALALALALVLPACTRGPLGPADSTRYQIPWPDSAAQSLGRYHLQAVDIPSLRDRESLSSDGLQILIEPAMQNGEITGERPVGRFIWTGDVWVPSDYSTLQATAVHAHMSRLAELDVAVSATASQDWPMRVALAAHVTGTPSGLETNNAIYDGRHHILLIVPYTEAAVPISFNGGILAHEHFHSIFYSIILREPPESSCGQQLHDDWNLLPPSWTEPLEARAGGTREVISTSELNELLLRGLNEGLADFWGWVYSGNPDFISSSLSDEGLTSSRRLDAEVMPLWSKESMLRKFSSCLVVEDRTRMAACKIAHAYAFGTLYARFLRELTLQGLEGEGSLAQRTQMARSVVEAMKSMAGEVATAQAKASSLSGDLLLRPLALTLRDLDPKRCALLRKFAGSHGPSIDLQAARCGEQITELKPLEAKSLEAKL